MNHRLDRLLDECLLIARGGYQNVERVKEALVHIIIGISFSDTLLVLQFLRGCLYPGLSPRMTALAGAEILPHSFGDVVLFGAVKLGEHRQRNDLSRDVFRNREVSPAVSECAMSVLEVKGNWIMNAGADVEGRQPVS